MRVQEAIVRQLQLSTTATYAIVGTRTFWSVTGKNPEIPFVRVRKSGHLPQSQGMVSRRLPGNANIEVICYAKSQDAAADLADAVAADLTTFRGKMPGTSPVTSGAIYVSQVEPGNEEDLVTEELFDRNIFAEAREYIVRYDDRA